MSHPGAWVTFSLCVISVSWGVSKTWAYEPTHPVSVNIEKLRRPAEESENLKEFFKQRINVEAGFDETYNDNVLLQDNNRQEDYISALESRILFADPRGALLYGGLYIVDLFRYHRLNRNAIDHRPRLFFDYDSGGRLLYRFDYQLLATNHIVFGTEQIDILRREGDFQRTVEHRWKAKLSYALNETNSLIPQVEYSLFDDQSVNDSDSDRKLFKGIVDIDHDLRPNWGVYGGYTYENTIIPGRKKKGSTAHGVRFGTHYKVSEIVDLDILSKLERRAFQTGQHNNNLSLTGTGAFKLGPRTTLSLGYTDERIASFAVGRLQFRSVRPSLSVEYEMTPLTTVSLGASSERLHSGGRDVETGQAATTVTSRQYGLKAAAKWQIREQIHIDLDYAFSRAKTRDTTNHIIRIGIKAQL